MKKSISLFLAVLLTFMCAIPAFAAEGETVTEKHSVIFQQPSFEFEGGYMFVKSVNGEIQYKEDPDGIYVFYKDRYMTMDNIFENYWDEVPPERYSPVQVDLESEVAHGETVIFKVMTSPKYNVATAAVFVNGQRMYLNANDEYAIYVDRDLIISVAEYDANGQPAILRNHYNVKLTSGDGYKVRTLRGQNYNVVYYGDSFRFRVAVLNGYSASGIKVTVQRGSNDLSEYLGDEFDVVGNLMGANEELVSYGIDEDGYRLYEVQNITTDCKIIVSGVQEESSVGVMAMLKRILRLILDFLGIDSSFLGSITNYYTVDIDASEADGITYEVIRSSSDELTPNEFTVTSGEGITVVVTKKSLEQEVNVMWTPGNDLGTYQTNWVLDFNTVTGEVTYSAVYNIDNITADTRVIIR